MVIFSFLLGQCEVWGPHAHAYVRTYFFTQKLVERNWLDIEPNILNLTWKNNRCGEGRVAKRLDHFLVLNRWWTYIIKLGNGWGVVGNKTT